MEDSQRVLAWYERQIAASEQKKVSSVRGAPRSAPDLLVESLFYRMRADPVAGYHWYLRQADQAIRSAQTGLDMRLRDSMALFLTSASPDEKIEPGHSLSSPIDRANIKALLPEFFDDFLLDSATLWIERYTVRGKLDAAQRVGAEMKSTAELMFEQDPQRYRLPFAEFLLWYGQVVMYGYNIKQALEIYHQVLDLLKGTYPLDTLQESARAGELSEFDLWRLSLVLGRTYNNLGYTHWMYLGQYRQAIREFQQAIRLYRMADLEEELANSNDNMGRVYALLGGEFQATQLIQNGLLIRKKLGLTYREALSANSLAQALIRFGQAEPALRAIEDALIQFRRVGVDRGIGLGLLTRGMIYRTMAGTWREMELPISEALHYTDKAETDLRDAMRIFAASVREPIREVQVRNEMASCYRARYLLLVHSGASEAERELALTQGRLHYRQAVDVAKKHGYIVDELDTTQDLAVLFTRAGEYDNADKLLDRIRGQIPDQYKIQAGKGLEEPAEAEPVDAYYKLMGQVELLAGAIEYERGKTKARQQGKTGDQPAKQALLKTTRHYLFAVSYFNRYSGETFANRLTYARIYKRFQDCTPDLIQEITEQHLPRWVKEYNLPGELVRGLFQDVFGIFP
jgi:tetratricopeptide (TPR) repeat protein